MKQNNHVTYVTKMDKDNPFYELGYRWEWECVTCNNCGGAQTQKEAMEQAKRHRNQPKMNDTKHVPWSVEDPANDSVFGEVWSVPVFANRNATTGHKVAGYGSSPDRKIARERAWLFAAAPELLKASEAALSERLDGDGLLRMETVDTLRAAIAKATGKQHAKE